MTTYPSPDASTCNDCPFATMCPVAGAGECPTVGELATIFAVLELIGLSPGVFFTRVDERVREG